MEVVLVIAAVAAIVLVLGASLWAGGHPKRRGDQGEAIDNATSDPAGVMPLMAHGGSSDDGHHPQPSDDNDHSPSQGVSGSWDTDASGGDVGGDSGGDSGGGGGGD